MEVSSQVLLAGVTSHPFTAWVTRPARNLSMTLDDQGRRFRNRDTNFIEHSTNVYGADGNSVIDNNCPPQGQ